MGWQSIRTLFPTSRVIIGEYATTDLDVVPRNVEIRNIFVRDYAAAVPAGAANDASREEQQEAEAELAHFDSLTLPSGILPVDADFAEWRAALHARGARFSDVALSAADAVHFDDPSVAQPPWHSIAACTTRLVVSNPVWLGSSFMGRIPSPKALREFANLRSVEWRGDIPYRPLPGHVVRALRSAEEIGCAVSVSDQVSPLPDEATWNHVFMGFAGARVEWTPGSLSVGNIYLLLHKMVGDWPDDETLYVSAAT
jgi:hypothetical protein